MRRYLVHKSHWHCRNFYSFFPCCSVQELKDLENDEDKLLQMLRDLPQLQQVALDRDLLCRENEDLASIKPIII